MTNRNNNEATVTTGLMGGSAARDNDRRERFKNGRQFNNFNGRTKYGYGEDPSRVRYNYQKLCKGRIDWNSTDRPDLRNDIERNRMDMIAIPESRNDEPFKKRVKFGDDQNTYQGQGFR